MKIFSSCRAAKLEASLRLDRTTLVGEDVVITVAAGRGIARLVPSTSDCAVLRAELSKIDNARSRVEASRMDGDGTTGERSRVDIQKE